MLLSDIFTVLSNGELSNMDIGGRINGGILAENYPQIISHINSGVKELHNKFPLKLKELIVQLNTGQEVYLLTNDYAVTNPNLTVFNKYILDTVGSPFTNDIISIQQVFDNIGTEYPINNYSEPTSIFTPEYNKINVPSSLLLTLISIIYRAAPEVIPSVVLDPTIVTVDLPDHFLDAICSFVAYRIFLGLDAEKPEYKIYYDKYSEACKIIKEQSLVPFDSGPNNNFRRQGWV